MAIQPKRNFSTHKRLIGLFKMTTSVADPGFVWSQPLMGVPNYYLANSFQKLHENEEFFCQGSGYDPSNPLRSATEHSNFLSNQFGWPQPMLDSLCFRNLYCLGGLGCLRPRWGGGNPAQGLCLRHTPRAEFPHLNQGLRQSTR